ncbi:MAG: hypothetical protein ACLP5E_16570 [Streptosporangiaceae bacterium]
MTPRIAHREFLRAVQALMEAYAILGRAIASALPEQLAAVAAVDPLSRIVLEQFGDPLVRWFRRGSGLRGVHVADGTVVFADDGAVLFVSEAEAEHDDDLPAGWRDRAEEVGRLRDGAMILP